MSSLPAPAPSEAALPAHVSLHSIDSAAVIVPMILEFLPIQSVVDFGCKHGEWLREFKKHGATRVLGLDRRDRPERLVIDSAEFRNADLGQPVSIDGRYDLAVCIEVAEHLPAAAAEPLVRTMTQAAPLALFSAAIPDQGGHGHLNERPHSYWTALFASHGFVRLDCIRPRIWQDPRVAWWYRQNLFLFAGPEALARSAALQRESQRPIADDMEIIHKDVVRRRASITSSLRELAGSLKRGAWSR